VVPLCLYLASIATNVFELFVVVVVIVQ